MINLADAKDLSALFVPWVAIGVSVFVAFRVQAVHTLVNSEMDKFRATLKALADANEKATFVAGQQQVRDANRGVTTAAANATTAAAQATRSAAESLARGDDRDNRS